MTYPHHYGPRGEGRRRDVIPYAGPDRRHIRAGDLVDCEDLRGGHRRKIACGPARYDHTDTGRGPVPLTVPVADPDAWHAAPDTAPQVNWDAAAVTVITGHSPEDG